jgi:hypothetical protein
MNVSFWNGVDFQYQIMDVPDFDQRRAADLNAGILGLPNNGQMYCVPTTEIDWMDCATRSSATLRDAIMPCCVGV